MSFSGKATFTAGATLPEIAEDVSDLVAINSPHETPLLNALGDAARSARSTVHEWLEESLLSNTADLVSFDEGTDVVTIPDATAFRVGAQITDGDGTEVMLIAVISTG